MVCTGHSNSGDMDLTRSIGHNHSIPETDYPVACNASSPYSPKSRHPNTPQFTPHQSQSSSKPLVSASHSIPKRPHHPKGVMTASSMLQIVENHSDSSQPIPSSISAYQPNRRVLACSGA
jgi:hypothetical protein